MYNELATFAILPISSSKEGVIGGIARQIARLELAPVLTCEVTLPGKDETMTMGLFAESPVAVENADYLEAVLFSDEGDLLTSLLLSAEALNCRITEATALIETEGFRYAWRTVFERGNAPSLFAVWLLLRCEYPHHRLCGIARRL